jgi:hypothetical protein
MREVARKMKEESIGFFESDVNSKGVDINSILEVW